MFYIFIFWYNLVFITSLTPHNIYSCIFLYISCECPMLWQKVSKLRFVNKTFLDYNYLDCFTPLLNSDSSISCLAWILIKWHTMDKIIIHYSVVYKITVYNYISSALEVFSKMYAIAKVGVKTIIASSYTMPKKSDSYGVLTYLNRFIIILQVFALGR